MAESLLSKIVKTDKKTFKTIESIDKRMSALVIAQQKEIKHKKEQQKLDKKILQEERRKKADSSLGDKVKNLLGGDKEKTKGWFQSFLESIGDVIKSIAPIALVGALGLGLIGTAIYKFFSDEKFRAALMDNVINPLINNIMKGISDISNGVFRIISGNDQINNPGEAAKSTYDDFVTKIWENVDRKNSEKALTTFKERLEQATPEDLGITSEEKEKQLKRIDKVLKLIRSNTKDISAMKRLYDIRKRGPSWFESKEAFEERLDKEITRRSDEINRRNEKLLNLQQRILDGTQVDISKDIIDPITGTQVEPVQKQTGGLVNRKRDKQDPRYKLGKMEMRGFMDESQNEVNETVIKRQTGGLVLFAGHNDVPNGHEQPGTDAPGTDLQGKYKPTAEQHFADEVARETQALAKKEKVPISYQPSTGRYDSGDHPDSNWSKMGRIRSSGGSAIELHFDAYGYEGGRLIQGTRGMIINGYSLSENEKKVQKAFGTHPSGDTFGGLILELDTINKAPGNSKSYARMIVDAMEGVTGPAPQIEAGSNRGDAAKQTGASPPPQKKNLIEQITTGLGMAGQAFGAVFGAFMDVFGDDLGALFNFGGGSNPSNKSGDGSNTTTQNDSNNVTPSTNAKSLLLAAGTNDYSHPDGAATNVKKMVEALKGKNYDTTFVSPTSNGRFADVSGKTTAAAAGAGAKTLMPGAWDSDGYHIHMDEAKKIRDNHPGSVIIGDSNAARIEGTNGTPGRTKVGAGTSEILQFVNALSAVEMKQKGGIVGSPRESDSMMMTMSEDQFFDRLQDQFEVIDVYYPVSPPANLPEESGSTPQFDTSSKNGFDEALRFAAGVAFS